MTLSLGITIQKPKLVLSVFFFMPHIIVRVGALHEKI